MKVPIQWLQEYVDLPSAVTTLTDKLTSIGHMQDHPPQEVAGDTVLDLEVRQNRSDCLSILGIAREVAASLEKTVKLPAGLDTALLAVTEPDFITINTTECYRFHALRFDNIKVGPSPEWLKKRLEAYGIKSINTVVDITNFVMVEVGEPLHAFDATKINKGITIRLAKKGEKITVLGNRTIDLHPEDIVISDAKSILALGGIIGGLNSGISDSTTSIVLEAATYNQAFVRRTSLRHSLRTEASLRHEKFLHPELTESALSRATHLMSELCGGSVTTHYDTYPKPFAPVTVTMSLSYLEKLAGLAIPAAKAVAILQRLGMETHTAKADIIDVSIPYFRTDLTQEEDVIEEVLRIHGYEQIPDVLPTAPPPTEITTKAHQIEEEVRDILVGFGFDEIITEPLVREAEPAQPPVMLENSLNADKTMLRTTLRNQLEQAISYQRKVKKGDLSLFEIGQIYTQPAKNKYVEKKMLAGIMTGSQVTYLHAKGMLEALTRRLGRPYQPAIFTITPVNATTFYFEVAIDDLVALTKVNADRIITVLPQIITQDISVSVPTTTAVGELLIAVREVSPLLYKVDLGESPRDLGKGRKGVFIKLQYHRPEQQLTTSDIEPIRQQIMTLIEKKYQGQLR